MQLTAIQLRNQARFKSNFSDTTSLTNAEVLTQLNEGYSKLISAIVEANQDYYEEQKSVFSLVALSSLYSLPSDCIKVKQVRLAYSTPTSQDDFVVARSYDPVDTYDVNIDELQTPISNPVVDITNNYCRIFPVPTTDVTGGGQFYYIARPSALVLTGDTMIVPADYQDLAATYAGAKIAERFKDFNRADRLIAEFNAGIEKMKNELIGREMNREYRFRNITEVPRHKTTEIG